MLTRPRASTGRGGLPTIRNGTAIFLAPALIVMFLFLFLPVLDAFRLSFTNWNGITAPVPVGFKNYLGLAHDPVFRDAVKNNLIAVLMVPAWVVIPYLLAVLILDPRVRASRFYRFAYFLPVVIPPVALGILYTLILAYDGPLSSSLRALGLDSLGNVQWLVQSNTAFFTVLAIVIWASFGVGVMVFLGALSAVDPELESAARLDGASWQQMQRFVVLPQVRRTIEFWTVLTLISCFTVLFPYIFVLTQGGPGTSSTVIDFNIYSSAFFHSRFGYASAMGVVAMCIVAVPVSIALWLLRRGER